MPDRTFANHYVRSVAFSLGGGMILILIGFLPTYRLAGSQGVSSMFLGVGASVAVSLLGAVPVCLGLTQQRDKVPNAILLGTAVRFLAILILVLAGTFSGLVHRSVFVCWVAVSYLVLLLIDTLVALWGIRSREGVVP